MADCIFCKIASKQIPATLLAETDGAIAIRDLEPAAPVHVLIIPKKHVESLNQADAALMGELMSLAARVAKEQGIAESGYRVTANTNAHGGQTVFHLHLHVLGGRAMAWPPG